MSLAGNTEKINELLSKINALPEAGEGGSGGVAVETCTVKIYRCYHVFYTGLDDSGAVCTLESAGSYSSSNHTITAVRNTPIICGTLGGLSARSENAVLYVMNSNLYAVVSAFAETATIRFEMSGGSS